MLGIVPAGTVLHPPFSVILTDLTPATGGTVPQGEVGLDGIWGHRIEKTLQLQIDIKDATGATPEYPVLVQLNLSGPAKGTLLVNQNQTACDHVAMLWHERDGEGNLIPNDTVGYTLGMWARYVGVLPDAGSPGGVKPVWGTAETVHLSAQAARPDGQRSDPYLAAHNVHPEPGRPHEFRCRYADGQLCDDTFRFWPGYLGGQTGRNAYHIVDTLGNTVFGLTSASATPIGGGVSVDFTSQLLTGGAPEAYTLSVQWPTDSSRPSGTFPVTLSVDVPADPAGDWPAGSVTRDITLDFQGGETRMLVGKQNYDARFEIDDGAMPMTVSPGAGEGGLPTTAAGDTPRLVLLAMRGTHIPTAIAKGTDEPSLEEHKVYRKQDDEWQKVEVSPTAQDVVLDTEPGGTFRFSLVDGGFNLVPDTAFRVHRCPRGEHLTHEDPPPEPCTLGPVDSDGQTGILPALDLNQTGATRGYLGIELTRAPINPGTYFILVESIGPTPYRIRQGADFVRRAGQESEYFGAYRICTVAGGEFLDENFVRIDQFTVDEPRLGFVRLIDSSVSGRLVDATVSTETRTGTTLSGPMQIQLERVGASNSFLAAVSFRPRGYSEPAPAAAGRQAGPLPDLLVDSITSVGRLFRTGYQVARQMFRTRPMLQIEWLDEGGVPFASGAVPRQVTRIVKLPDPQDGGHFLYAEETWVRVAARNRSGELVTDAVGDVRLDEVPDTTFVAESFFTSTENWQYSYQGDAGAATNLGPSRPADAPTLGLPLLSGQGQTAPVRLLSLAGPRSRSQHNGYDTFEVTWEAQLQACDAAIGAACPQADTMLASLRPGAVTEVSQWVDQVSYRRTAWSEPLEGQNGVRDWIEAIAWDALWERASSADPIVREVVARPTRLLSDNGNYTVADAGIPATGDDPCPHDPYNDSYWIRFYPQGFFEDALRWDRSYRYSVFGVNVEFAHFLTEVTLHEARHLWQRWMASCEYSDGNADHDDLHPTPVAVSGDLLAGRLADAPFADLVPGGNPETHLGGPDHDDRGSMQRELAIERDALCFQSRRLEAGSPVCPGITSAMEPMTRVAPQSESPLVVAKGSLATLIVRVQAQDGYFADDPNKNRRTPADEFVKDLAGTVITFEVVEKPEGAAWTWSTFTNGTPVPPSASRTVAVTNQYGEARVDLTPTSGPGRFTMRIRATQMGLASLEIPGAILKTHDFVLDVTEGT